MMAQFVHMDARLDTLSDELCQVNTRVGRITVETEAAPDTDDSSSGVYLSIHLYSFVKYNKIYLSTNYWKNLQEESLWQVDFEKLLINYALD